MDYSLENGKPCTIGTLFHGDNKVVIPDMQREYCWARTINPITGKPLVFNYIKDIIDLYAKNKVIRMGLIYAYQAPQTFIQLCDGQQRITTLYLFLGLLHKRLLKEKDLYSDTIRRILISKFEEENDDKEPRLQYAIRESTLWFTRDLVNEYFLKEEDSSIQHSPWYFDEYNLDPSIENMVDAISLIESILCELDGSKVNGIAHFVIEKISFLYYDMGNRQYGEDQFVVINTTGVGLSNTENIKPKLISSIADPKDKELFANKWEEEWEHFFWTNLRKDDSPDYIVDPDFNEFFRWIFIIEKAGEGTLTSDKTKFTLAQKALDGDPFNLFEIAEGDALKIAQTIDSYIKAYKFIIEKNLYPEWLSIQRTPKGERQSVNQIEAFRFLPMLYFVKSYLSEEKKLEYDVFSRNYDRLKQFIWGRSFSKNLSRASIETVPRAIEITKRICHECEYDIVRFPELDPSETRFFTEGERKKYTIYKERLNNKGEDVRIEFEDKIWEVERLDSCLGNITCIFDALQLKGFDYHDLTIEMIETFYKIMNGTINHPSNKFRRALMTYGEYWLWIGSTPSLNAWKCSFGDDASFFRNILANRNDEKRREVIIRFIADIYSYLKERETTVDAGLPQFLEDKISGYSSHVPSSEFDGMLTKIITEEKWLDKSNQSHFAWDDNIKKGYVLYWDRSNQGYDAM